MSATAQTAYSTVELQQKLAALRRLVDLPRPSPAYKGGRPFYFGGPVQINSRFVGRKHELQSVADYAARGQDVSLVGERRMGKSSLLWQLYLERRTLLPNCLVGYVDMQCFTCHTQRGFLTAALRTLLVDLEDPALLGRLLAEGLIGDLADDEALDIKTFGAALRALASDGERPLLAVLLIDEFEAMLQYPQEFDDVFFRALRDLGTRRYVGFVIASHQPLVTLLNVEVKSKSSFANIFVQRPLGGFSAHEARELVCQDNDRPFEEREINLALRLGRNRPHLLQLAASEIYRAKYETPPDLARVEREFATLVANTLSVNETTGAGGHGLDGHGVPGWLRPLAAVGQAVLAIGRSLNDMQNLILGIAVIVIIILILVGVLDPGSIVRLLGIGQR